MTEAFNTEFTTEELLSQARGNATAFVSNVLGLEPYTGDAMWDSFYPIMERLGISYAWRREDGAVRLSFERDSA
jgi:hypothetical protein